MLFKVFTCVLLVHCITHMSEALPQAPKTPIYPEMTSCPEEYGLQTYPHPLYCDAFYSCKNGTFAEEKCEHGLLYDGRGSAYNHCNYYWAVHCEDREYQLEPQEGDCPYAFGLFKAGECETYYIKCEYSQPNIEECIKGLAYDNRTHSCNWPDLMEYCESEKIAGFTCPDYIDPREPAHKYLPYPRFAADNCGQYVVCVNNKPRLSNCGAYSVFDDQSLICTDPDLVPRCANYFGAK